ncbi:MAG: hypothetical protein RR365_14140 [Bacteroides sp.]
MRKVIVPNSFFEEAVEVLKTGKSVKLHIDGQSMYPFIHGGTDLVEVVPYDAREELPRWCCPLYQWEGKYMIHRYIGKKDGLCQMLGDGNVVRIETVKQEEIAGLLRTIYRPDGTVQDCREPRWIRRSEWWYRLRKVRRVLLPLFRILSI